MSCTYMVATTSLKMPRLQRDLNLQAAKEKFPEVGVYRPVPPGWGERAVAHWQQHWHVHEELQDQGKTSF